MPASNTYDAIQSYTLTSNTPSVTFSSMPQTYTNLVMVINAIQRGREILSFHRGSDDLMTHHLGFIGTAQIINLDKD